MCCDGEECGGHSEAKGHRHGGCHRGHHEGWGFPLMSVVEEVEALEGMKGNLEKQLEIVNKRLELLKR